MSENTNIQAQVEAAQVLSEEQLAEVMDQAKKELGLVVKALRTGNRENAVSQYLAGMHGLRFINLCRQAGKARAFATDELERDLSWWLGKSVDANLLLRTYGAVTLLHGSLEPVGSKATAAEKKEWAERVDKLPPVGHFHKAWSQLVERVEDGLEERWVLLQGYEEKCIALYQDACGKGLKLEDSTDQGKVLEKGILTRVREHMVDYMRFKADKKAQEAAQAAAVKEELTEAAKVMEDKATEQQAVVKGLLEKVQAATPEDKANLEAEAKDAARQLDEYRKQTRAMIDQAAAVAKVEKAAEVEALEAEKKAEKGTAKLERKQRDAADQGRDLPWQAQAENAAEKCSSRDLAEALANVVEKHPEPEDVLYAMLQAHKKDASNAFRQALAAFALTWERASKQTAQSA